MAEILEKGNKLVDQCKYCGCIFSYTEEETKNSNVPIADTGKYRIISTIICPQARMEDKIDKEQLIEDLHFLSDRGNYKSIKYAIECIDKLAKIEQIINTEIERGDCVLHCSLTEQISEVLNE